MTKSKHWRLFRRFREESNAELLERTGAAGDSQARDRDRERHGSRGFAFSGMREWQGSNYRGRARSEGHLGSALGTRRHDRPGKTGRDTQTKWNGGWEPRPKPERWWNFYPPRDRQ